MNHSQRNIPQFSSRTCSQFNDRAVRSQSSEDVSMRMTVRSIIILGAFPWLAISSIGTASAQADVGKALLEKLTARVAKLESACASDIKKYCKTVTPGEGRMIYCMQAHEDKISPKCAFELGEATTSVQTTADVLKDTVIACKAEISGPCGKILPGQGRMVACLLSNKSTASAGCVEAIQKIESMAAQ